MKRNALLLFGFMLSALVVGAQNNNTCLYFDYAKHDLTHTAKLTMDSLSNALLTKGQQYQVQLIGHTDRDGNQAYNQELSLKRCQEVKNYLVEKGFVAANISMEGRNFTDSITNNISDMGKARNRRVELIFTAISANNVAGGNGIKTHTLRVGKMMVPNLDKKVEVNTFTAEQGIKVTYKSGTSITIPPSVLVYPDGKPVVGEVQLEYFEMRDAADFIAAGIPMEFKNKIFNSAGMFDVKVTQNGQELQVREGQYYDMEFAKTENLPDLGFYKYDPKTERWTTLGPLDESSKSFDTNTKDPCFQPNDGFVINAKDTVTSFFNAMELGRFLSKNKGVIREYAQDRFFTMEQRWWNLGYNQTKFMDGAHWREKDMLIAMDAIFNTTELELTDDLKTHVKALNDTYIKLKIMDTTSALQVLKDYNWLYIKKDEIYSLDKLRQSWIYGNREVLHEVTKKPIVDTLAFEMVSPTYFINNQQAKWQDARLEYNSQKGALDILLKGDKFSRITLYPVANSNNSANKYNAKDSDKLARKIFEQYQKSFKVQAAKFDSTISQHKASWPDFLYYSEPFRRGKERCLEKAKWISFFDKNHGTTMDPRYEMLLNAPKDADTIACLLRQGSLPPQPLPPGSAMGQSLRLTGFGVFNCDQVTLLGNSILVDVQYQTPDGKLIDAAQLYIVDYKLNTAMSFTSPYKFRFNPTSPTALYLMDNAGRSYFVPAGIIKQIPPKSSSGDAYTLIAEDITDRLKTTDDLRNILGLTTR